MMLFGIHEDKPRVAVMSEDVAKDYLINHCTLPNPEDFKTSFDKQLRKAARLQGIKFPSSFPIQIVAT